MMVREGISVDMAEKTCSVCGTFGPEQTFVVNETIVGAQPWDDGPVYEEQVLECPDCENDWTEYENLEE